MANSVNHDAVTPRSRVDWMPRPPRDLVCPACGASGLKPFVLAADASWAETGHVDLFACPHCDSKFFPDVRCPEYESFEDFDSYLKLYLEVGAGVDQLVRHLFVTPLRPGAQYLEVGCGFGFALDFARGAMALDVLGIDPSPFARAGARLLTLPIIGDYLTPETDFAGRSFDLAVASEVIEHIFDPLPFVRLIADRLSPGGILILTTPNAAKAAPDTPLGALLPLLSAGWHCILYSRTSLERLLRDAGFRRIEIAVREHTLVAVATNGDAPIDLEAKLDRNMFQAYLEARRRTAGFDSSLAFGFGYRLLKELTNTKQYQQGLELYEELRLAFRRVCGFDMETPHTRWLYSHPEESLSSFATRYPMCLCGVAYLRGILALNREGEPGRAMHFFSLSTCHGSMLRNLLQAVGSDDAETEVLIARGRALYLRALAYASPMEAATGASRLLQEERTRPLAYPQQRDDVVAILSHLVNMGALEAAEKLVPETEAYLRSDSASDPLRCEVWHAFGRLEMNRRHRPRQAALYFALAERAAKLWHRREHSAEAMEQIWRARHDRFIAWLVAGNARRALCVGRRFEPAKMLNVIPRKELTVTFVHLVNLGALEAAEKLSPEAEALLAEQSTERGPRADKLRYEVRRALGLIEINRRCRPRQSALQFALAERAAKRWHCSEDTPTAMEQIWRARFDRLHAWMVAGNAPRALLVGRLFEAAPVLNSMPDGMRERARKLTRQASTSLASGTDSRYRQIARPQ